MNRNDLPAPNKECEVCGRKYRRCKKCIEMKNRGVEAWREHCDSVECYMTLVFSQTSDISKLTMDDYNNIVSLELPEGRKPVEEIQKKLDRIKETIENNNRKDSWKYIGNTMNNTNKHKTYEPKQIKNTEKENGKTKDKEEKMNVK